MNIINLTDGVDGLAAGVCVISAAALAVIALSLDRNAAGVLAALTAGAALGFLRHGFPPASSFMGDTGSNLLGYLLGCIAIQGALKTNAVVALFLPLIVLTVPILDTSFVIAKRIKYRRPIYEADRSHFHHRMANLGFSQRRTLAYLYAWALVMAGLALALRFVPYSDDRGNFDPAWTALMAVFLAIALAASVYLVVVLEILKLRGVRSRQLAAARPGVASGARPRSTRASRASSRRAASPRSTPNRASSARSTPKPGSSKRYRRPPAEEPSQSRSGYRSYWIYSSRPHRHGANAPGSGPRHLSRHSFSPCLSPTSPPTQMSQEPPTRMDAATAGMALVGAMVGCGAVGYGLGSLVGAGGSSWASLGLFVGIVGGMVLVHARFKRI